MQYGGTTKFILRHASFTLPANSKNWGDECEQCQWYFMCWIIRCKWVVQQCHICVSIINAMYISDYFFKPEVICPWLTQFARFMARTRTHIHTFTAIVGFFSLTEHRLLVQYRRRLLNFVGDQRKGRHRICRKTSVFESVSFSAIK